MKKLLFVAALGMACLMSAKDNAVKSPEKVKFNSEKFALRIAYHWVSVKTSCGKVFYLNGDDYIDCYECLQEHARQFADAQCGEGAGFDLPY